MELFSISWSRCCVSPPAVTWPACHFSSLVICIRYTHKMAKHSKCLSDTEHIKSHVRDLSRSSSVLKSDYKLKVKLTTHHLLRQNSKRRNCAFITGYFHDWKLHFSWMSSGIVPSSQSSDSVRLLPGNSSCS